MKKMKLRWMQDNLILIIAVKVTQLWFVWTLVQIYVLQIALNNSRKELVGVEALAVLDSNLTWG